MIVYLALIKKRKTNRKFTAGFTLIELLVVISIISLLSSITWASINNARDKAKNAKILAEVHEAKNSVGQNYETKTYTLPASTDNYFTIDKGTYTFSVIDFGGGIVKSTINDFMETDAIFSLTNPNGSASATYFKGLDGLWRRFAVGLVDENAIFTEKYFIIRKAFTESKLTLPDNVTYWGSTAINGGPRPW